MKRLMILGGSENQLPIINFAKKLGLYIVLCDYSQENPGKLIADAFHCVSTLDREAVLKVAREEKIDGVVTNSEPAMPVAAYVGNKLGLPSCPEESIITLSQKDLFRKFLSSNGFNCPGSVSVESYEEALTLSEKLSYPLMVKPIDSSGSRGVSRIESADELELAYNNALGFSKKKKVIIEEFILRAHDYMIGGDIFVLNGKVVFWGLMNSMRDFEVSEFVPVGTSFPTYVSKEQFEIIEKEMDRLIKTLQIESGPFNLELMFNKRNELFMIEVNPRNGGNKIPEILRDATGVDLIEKMVLAALGEKEINFERNEKEKFMSTYVLHSDRDGTLIDIIYDESIKERILKVELEKQIGEQVEKFSNASKLIGIVTIEFKSLKEMKSMLSKINSLVKIVVK